MSHKPCYEKRKAVEDENVRLRAELAEARREVDGISRTYNEHSCMKELSAIRAENAALAAKVKEAEAEAKKQWRLRMTGSGCAVCGGQGAVSTAAIKLPETYKPCPSCSTNGPWDWLRYLLTVEDFQRLSKQHGDVVINARKEVQEAAAAREKVLTDRIAEMEEVLSEARGEFDREADPRRQACMSKDYCECASFKRKKPKKSTPGETK